MCMNKGRWKLLSGCAVFLHFDYQGSCIFELFVTHAFIPTPTGLYMLERSTIHVMHTNKNSARCWQMVAMTCIQIFFVSANLYSVPSSNQHYFSTIKLNSFWIQSRVPCATYKWVGSSPTRNRVRATGIWCRWHVRSTRDRWCTARTNDRLEATEKWASVLSL